MKKTFKTVIATVVTMVLLSTIVLGATPLGATIIEATLNPERNIKLNNAVVNMTDANGNEVYPISYNDTTYLPVRAISENLGLAVAWDGDTQTVILGNTNTKVALTSGESAMLDKDNSKLNGTSMYHFLIGSPEKLIVDKQYAYGVISNETLEFIGYKDRDSVIFNLNHASSKFGGVLFTESEAIAYDDNPRYTTDLLYTFRLADDDPVNPGAVLYSKLVSKGDIIEFEFNTMGASKIIMDIKSTDFGLNQSLTGLLEPYYIY